MALVRWNPIGTLAGMEIDRLHRMFEDLQTEAFNQAWVPAVDIYETDTHEVVIQAELPDVKKEDIGVTFENNVLTLTGERKQDASVRARAVPARRASLRQLQPFVHAAGVGRRRPDRRVLQGRRADHSAPAPRRGEAEADLRQHRITAGSCMQVRRWKRPVERGRFSPPALARAEPPSGADPPFRLLLRTCRRMSPRRTRTPRATTTRSPPPRSPADFSSWTSRRSAPSSSGEARCRASTGSPPATRRTSSSAWRWKRSAAG